MKKVVRLTERDLTRIVKRVLMEKVDPELKIFNKDYFKRKKQGKISLKDQHTVSKIDGTELENTLLQFYSHISKESWWAGISPGDYDWEYGDSLYIGPEENNKGKKPGIFISKKGFKNGSELGTILF